MVDSSSIKQRNIALDHGDLTFIEAGSGDALVLLHGIGSAALSWRAQIAELSDSFRVIAWNAPGYSGSSPFAEPAPRVDAYAEALKKFLDALGVKRCHLVGHSLGTLIAARYAADHPERVLTLTLASCALGHANLPPEEREKLLRGRLDDLDRLGPTGMAKRRAPRLLGPRASQDQIESVQQNMAAIDPSGYAQAARMLGQSDLLADIRRLPHHLPVQIIYGTADVITPPQVNLRAAAMGAHVTVAPIEDAGHALYVEFAAEFNRIIRQFIEPHDG